MTDPAALGDSGLREAIVGALTGQPVVRDYYTLPITPRDGHLLADVLLPIVHAYGAEELRAAAEDMRVAWPSLGEHAGKTLDRRAAALAADAPPPVTSDLLTALRALPHVAAVRDEWFHGSVRVAVYLTEWDEDTWHGAHDLIDAFARPHVREFGVDGEVITPTRRTS